MVKYRKNVRWRDFLVLARDIPNEVWFPQIIILGFVNICIAVIAVPDLLTTFQEASLKSIGLRCLFFGSIAVVFNFWLLSTVFLDAAAHKYLDEQYEQVHSPKKVFIRPEVNMKNLMWSKSAQLKAERYFPKGFLNSSHFAYALKLGHVVKVINYTVAALFASVICTFIVIAVLNS